MTTTLTIPNSLMKRKQPIREVDWQIWEKKNFNIHRGVIEWFVNQSADSMEEIATRIRTGIKKEFHPGWFRGFGFGTILHFQTAPADFARVCNHIDTRNKTNGVWQWAIVLFDSDRIAIGIHTWLHGFLRPVYDSLLRQLEDDGYSTFSADAEIDQLFITLRKISITCRAIQKIGGLLT